MVVRKILETTLAAGSTSVTFTDSEIPYSLIRVYASNPDVLPTERVLSGNTVTVRYEAQSSSMGVALEIVKAGLEVIDSLTSTDDTAALSAKQGKVLKDALDALIVPDLSDLGDVTITSATDGQVLTYDDGVWINYTPVTALSGLTDVTITSAMDGQVLTYDDGEWINADVPSSGGDASWSSTERKVGTWYDGSDLYETTVYFSSPSKGTGVRVNHGISNISQVCNYDYSFITEGGTCYKDVGEDTSTNYWYTVCEVGKTSLRYTYGNNAYVTISGLFVKIQYTKTA